MQLLKIWLFLATVLISTAESQLVTHPIPELPKLENNEPVNAVGQLSGDKIKPESSVTRGIFEDSLVRDKTLNSVASDLKQLSEFTSLKTAAEKKSFAEKYTLERIKKLIESALILAPGQVDYAITDLDKKWIESFATKVSEDKYEVVAMTAPFDICGQLGSLMSFLSTKSTEFSASMTNADQLEQLSRSGIQWLAEKRVIEPGKVSPSDKKVIDDLSLLVLSKKWAAENKSTDVTTLTSQNRVAAHQPVLTDFLKTMPQTLIERNGSQSFHQIRDQVIDIGLRALQQRFLGTQALTDEERQHLVQLVDNVMKPFENVLGKIFQPNHRQVIPSSMQPVSQPFNPVNPFVLPATGFYGGYFRGHPLHGHKSRSY